MGPPYKTPRDSSFKSQDVLTALRLGDEEDSSFESVTKNLSQKMEGSGAQRLFLFSKQYLAENSPDVPPCHLEPTDIILPTAQDITQLDLSIPRPSNLIFNQNINNTGVTTSSSSQIITTPVTSPLYQALEVYEKQFMLHLCQGRSLADGADLRISSCRSCVTEQSVIARALRAAISNLSYYQKNGIRTRAELVPEFEQSHVRNIDVLKQFDHHITHTLSKEKLHPSLQKIARTSGRMMETLLDTVPVEKEKVWAAQCRKANDSLDSLFQKISESFLKIQNNEDEEKDFQADQEAEEFVLALSAKIETEGMKIRDLQIQRLDQLTKDHAQAVRVVMNALSPSSNTTTSTATTESSSKSEETQQTKNQAQIAQAAFSTLEKMSENSKNILPEMIESDKILRQIQEKVASSKTQAMKRMKERLHKISIAQSQIGSLLKEVNYLRAGLNQQTEDMSHLEHVVELKNSYKDFISEIRRRRAFGEAMNESCTDLFDKLNVMRNVETKCREQFLRGPGRHLMPAFFELFLPTLATLPPQFNLPASSQLPAMVELDTLPDVGVQGVSDLLVSNPRETSGGVSSSIDNSTSGEQEQQNDERNKNAVGDNEVSELKTKHNQQQQDATPSGSLIVSSVDTQGSSIQEKAQHDRSSCGGSSTINNNNVPTLAQQKTLAYENAMLRQMLERLGAKIPPSFTPNTTSTITTTSQVQQEELNLAQAKCSDLERELEDTKKYCNSLKQKLEELNVPKVCDKISHSSFNVSASCLCNSMGLFTSHTLTYKTHGTNLFFTSVLICNL